MMRPLIIVSIIFIMGCQNSPEPVNKLEVFNFPEFTEIILTNMQSWTGDVSKTFILDDNSESHLITRPDSIFWSRELERLISVDLQAPRYQGALELLEQNSDSNSNLLYDRINVTTDDLELRHAEVYYLEEKNQVRKIKLAFASDNFIANSSNHLTIWFNTYGNQLLVDSLVAQGNDHVLFQGERRFESRLRRIRK